MGLVPEDELIKEENSNTLTTEEAVEKYCQTYGGDPEKEKLKIMFVDQDTESARWNNSLFVPIKGKVFLHPDNPSIDESKYVKVIHSDFKVISIIRSSRLKSVTITSIPDGENPNFDELYGNDE